MAEPSAPVPPGQGPHEVDESLLEPWRYLMGVPGKDVRGLLIRAFQLWLRIPEEHIVQIQDIVTNLHTASLLIDDIEDNSRLRRGVPVAHKIFGVANTINCSNYVYFLALENCVRLPGDGQAAALRVFVAELLNLHRGQGQDVLWRDAGQCPTEEQYRAMVLDKTGGLFRLAVGLMQAFSANETDFTPLVNTLALYFQIRDDYVNLASHSYMQHKSFCEDITEGKFSYPVIHSIHAAPSDRRLLNILRQRTDDVELKLHAVQRLHETGSLAYTRRKLDELAADALREVGRLGGHAELCKLIEMLHGQLADCSDGGDGGSAAAAAAGGAAGGSAGGAADAGGGGGTAGAVGDEASAQLAKAAEEARLRGAGAESAGGRVSPALGVAAPLSGAQAAAVAAAALEPPPPVVGLKRMDILS